MITSQLCRERLVRFNGVVLNNYPMYSLENIKWICTLLTFEASDGFSSLKLTTLQGQDNELSVSAADESVEDEVFIDKCNDEIEG